MMRARRSHASAASPAAPAAPRSMLARVDAFARAEAHLQRRSAGGAVVSLLGCALALVLAAAEIRAYASPPPQTLMNVDTDARHPHEPLEVHLSVRFPAAPCELITIDALDISGERDQGIDERMLKTRLSANGTPLRTPDADFDAAAAAIVSSRGVPLDVPQAELVARRVEAAAARGEGCSMGGAFNVARVTGNFKATVHPSALGALRLAGHAVNLSHTIEQLSFGREFPGVINPLDGTSRALKSSDELVGATKYFVKVVPTTYLSSTSGTTESNQYSVTEFFSAATQSMGGSPAGVPAVLWIYDVSPIAVTIKEGRRSFGHLLSRLCAAAGGTFAITGLIARMGSSVGDMAK